MPHVGRGCTPNTLCRMLRNVQHLQPQPAGASVLVWLLPYCQGTGESLSASWCGPGDTGSTQGFVNARASSLTQRSACFLHYRLHVQGSSSPFAAFSLSLHSSSHEQLSFGYFSYSLWPERMRGVGGLAGFSFCLS